jgi:hypothetical protein
MFPPVESQVIFLSKETPIVRTRSYFQVCGVWEGWKGDFFQKQTYVRLRFSLRFVLIRVGYLSSSEAYTNYWCLFRKEYYLTFDWWKHFILLILRRSEGRINLTRPLASKWRLITSHLCTFPGVNESFWLAKYFHSFKLRSNFLPFANLYAL